MVAKITSLQHPKVKELVLLRTEKEAREEAGSLLLIGEKMIRELADVIPLKALFTLHPNPEIPADEHILLTESIFQKITGLPSSDGFVAVAPLPKQQNLSGAKRLLILDRLADPGNVGTLLRTALAFSWDGVVFTPDTVDPFNDKVLRASKGALFSLPFAQLTSDELLPLLESRSTYLADLEGISVREARFKEPLALILSNEATGPSNWAEQCAQKITISMDAKVESLNVAVSGAILLYEMRSSK